MNTSVAYTFRYLDAEGRFSRIAQSRCRDDADALRRATDGMDHDYVVLEISIDDRVVWRGLREEAFAAAKQDAWTERPRTARREWAPR